MFDTRYFRKGRTFFFINRYGTACRGRVSRMLHDDFKDQDLVEFVECSLVDESGRSFEFCGGRHVRPQDVFVDIEEMFTEIQRREEKEFERLCTEIKTIEDLVKFPLVHALFGEAFDLVARRAYKVKVKELLGVDLSYKPNDWKEDV